MVQKVDDPTDITGGLSAEEIEALREAGELPADEERDDPAGDGDEGARAALAEDDTNDDLVVDPDAATVDAKVDAAVEVKAGAAVDAKGDPVATADEDEPFLVDYRFDAKRVEAVKTELAAIDSQRDELRQKFADGEVDREDYDKEKDALDDKRADLRAEQMAQKNAEEMTARAQDQLWDRQQKSFFTADANRMFREDVDPVMFQALNTQLLLLTRQDEEKGLNRSGAAVLAEAAAAVRARFHMPEPKTEQTDEQKRRAEVARRAALQAGQQGRVPVTLAALPAASESDDSLGGEDPYADLVAMLDNPDPNVAMEAERRLAMMSPSEQRRFLEAS